MIQELCASIDLGSNSFRLLIARMIVTSSGVQFIPILNARKQVALAKGLDKYNFLDQASIDRAIDAFSYFKHKIQAVDKDKVFIAATSTFRVAKNIAILENKAQEILEIPIKTISGLEEARLIYLGTSHVAPYSEEKRLVIDIGGGSTEFILGKYHQHLLCDSANIGCIGISNLFFSEYTDINFYNAIEYVKQQLKDIKQKFNTKANQILGSSGTARVLGYLASQINSKEQEFILTRNGLDSIKKYLIECKDLENFKIKKINPSRMNILPGGLAIMMAIFDTFDLDKMYVCEGGVRYGLLYDNLENINQEDIRNITIESLQKRFCMNILPFDKIVSIGEYFSKQLNLTNQQIQLLTWALKTHHIGSYINADSVNKHSYYILSNSHMAGFNNNEQKILSELVLLQKGNLYKFDIEFVKQYTKILICLRLVIILIKNSLLNQFEKFHIKEKGQDFIITSPVNNILDEEKKYWNKINIIYNINYE